ncbi:hypothetical protein [Sphingopyxis sp.]|uniref:hypothetical protein n=1 Tax=Sphingopyxis sp. TaxID=1908224 RepID=UPI0026135F18|nr:hypothetical protein [Sphingopyxis sp.]MCW0199840.1 hypothetical protein [Sphingopyxis sp.]
MSEFRKVREVPTEVTKNPNVSTENQPEGSARRPSDTLDRLPARDSQSGGGIPENYNPASGTRISGEKDTRGGREGEGASRHDADMAGNGEIWDQRGTLTLAHDESDGSEVPPLREELPAPRPLREILARFAAAPVAERERYSLILESGQAFSSDDISAMLGRDDSPFR